MIVGGNGPCSAFLEEHGITPRTPIKVKYNSKAAEVYKTRIEALAEGKDWKPPANLAEMLKQASKPESSSPLKTNNQSRQNDGDKRSMKNSRGNSEDNDDWDDWGNAKSEPKSKNEPQSKRDAYFGKNQDSTPPSNARRQTTSSSSSPSGSSYGGGDYGGASSSSSSRFGNQRAISSAEFFGEDEPKKSGDDADVLKALGDGLSRFSMAALEVSKTAAEKIKQSSLELSKSAQEKGWSADVSVVGSKIAETSGKGWSLVQDYWTKARDSATEFAQQLNQQQGSEPRQQSPQQTKSFTDVDKKSDEDVFIAKPRGDLSYGNSVKEEEDPADLEDWLNDDDPQKKSSSSKKSDNRNKEETNSKTSKSTSKKSSKKEQGWDDWIEESDSPKTSKAAPKKEKGWDDDEEPDSPIVTKEPLKKSKDTSNKKKEEDSGWDDWSEEAATLPKKSDDWDNWDEPKSSPTSPKANTPVQNNKKKKTSAEGWDNWDEEW